MFDIHNLARAIATHTFMMQVWGAADVSTGVCTEVHPGVHKNPPILSGCFSASGMYHIGRGA